MIKLKIAPVNLKYQKILTKDDCGVEPDIQLVIYNDRIVYKALFYAEEPIVEEDPESGWEQIYNDYIDTVKKEAVVQMDLGRVGKTNVYSLTLYVSGGRDLPLYFYKKPDAMKAFRIIYEWIHNEKFESNDLH